MSHQASQAPPIFSDYGSDPDLVPIVDEFLSTLPNELDRLAAAYAAEGVTS